MIANKSVQTTVTFDVQTPDGLRRTVAVAASQIRPGLGFTFSVDVVDSAALTEETRAEIAEGVRAYLREEMTKAADLGVPLEEK